MDIKKVIADTRKALKETKDWDFVGNVDLLCKKVAESDKAVVECGVYNGHTIVFLAEFLRRLGKENLIYGFDTFTGFPTTAHQNDLPERFDDLLKEGRITKKHCEKAKERLEKKGTEHLEKDYFATAYDTVNDLVKEYPNVRLVKGAFADTLPIVRQIGGTIGTLFIDCDIYESYVTVLKEMYPMIQKGGVIIFDEYYSLKYPGARIAVDEFFADKFDGHFELHFSPDRFERWCWIKD